MMSFEQTATFGARCGQACSSEGPHESPQEHSRADEAHATLERVAMPVMMVRDFSDDDEEAPGRVGAVATPSRRRRSLLVGHWSCAACASQNVASAAACSSCGERRPRGPVAPPGSWACPVCMLSNARAAAKCEACFTRRPAKHGAPPASVFQTKVTLPVDLHFDVPEDFRPRQEFAVVDGPHGPVSMRVPEGSRPGEPVTVRLGPNPTYRVTLPARAKEGDTLTVEPPEGETIHFHVPPGKKAGDCFKVEPRVLMVRVPEGASRGDWVAFAAPDGAERMACVPRGVPPGQYFDVPLERIAF